MSMASYYQEGEQLDDLDPARNLVWRTATGLKVMIRDMKDGHLLNTIRVLQGQSPKGTTVTLKDETRRRVLLNAMANEAYRRGLQLLPVENAPEAQEHE